MHDIESLLLIEEFDGLLFAASFNSLKEMGPWESGTFPDSLWGDMNQLIEFPILKNVHVSFSRLWSLQFNNSTEEIDWINPFEDTVPFGFFYHED